MSSRRILAGIDKTELVRLREHYPYRPNARKINAYEDANYWVGVNVKRVQDLWLDRSPPFDILDLGCGHGELPLTLAPRCRSIVGVERTPEYLELARELAAEQKRFEDGKTVYTSLCVACHNENGEGRDKLGPPLTGSNFALTAAHVPVRILINGINLGSAGGRAVGRALLRALDGMPSDHEITALVAESSGLAEEVGALRIEVEAVVRRGPRVVWRALDDAYRIRAECERRRADAAWPPPAAPWQRAARARGRARAGCELRSRTGRACPRPAGQFDRHGGG